MIYFAEIPDDLLTGDRAEVPEFITYHRDHSCLTEISNNVKTYREYAEGRQKLTLTLKQRDLLENVVREGYCDNICAQIISEGAARLQFLRFTCEEASIAKFLEETYTVANLKLVGTQTHHDMMRDGNVCVSLNWDNNAKKVKVSREPWWDGESGIFVLHDINDPDRIAMAVKEWPVHKRDGSTMYRRVVWFRGEIQRWASDTQGGLWVPYSLPEDEGRPWPVPWINKSGDLMEPPVVHFPNAGISTDNYGMSELGGGILGGQDRLNDLQWIILAAARLGGYQMYTISGAAPQKDSSGNVVPVEIGPGAILQSPSSDTKYGTLPAGDLAQLVGAYEHELKTIARNARVPLHRLGQGNPPSGEALLRAEGPAIGKAERQVDVCTARWAKVGYRAVQLANAFGSKVYDEEAIVHAVMEEPDRRDKLSKSVIVNNLAERISVKEALRMMEYPLDKVDQIYQEIIEEAKLKMEMVSQQAGTGGDPPKPGGQGPKTPPPNK